MKICSHIHTKFSIDSMATAQSILQEAKRLCYEVLIISDHNNTSGAEYVQKYAQTYYPNIEVVIGAEFSTQYGHILALGIPAKLENQLSQTLPHNFDDVVEIVRKVNGLLFLAHPIQSKIIKHIEILEKLDGIELINARVESSLKRRQSATLNAKLSEYKTDLALIGGCDAHRHEELQNCYMESKAATWRDALLGSKTIYYKRPALRPIAMQKLKDHPNKSFHYRSKQCLKYAVGIPLDIINGLKRDKYRSIAIDNLLKIHKT